MNHASSTALQPSAVRGLASIAGLIFACAACALVVLGPATALGGQVGVLLSRLVLGPVGGAGVGTFLVALGMVCGGVSSLAVFAAIGALIGWRVGDSVTD